MHVNHSLPYTHTHTPLPVKPVIIPGVLQAPKISVTQLSAPLCSAAGEALRHSLTFHPDTVYTLCPLIFAPEDGLLTFTSALKDSGWWQQRKL